MSPAKSPLWAIHESVKESMANTASHTQRELDIAGAHVAATPDIHKFKGIFQNFNQAHPKYSASYSRKRTHDTTNNSHTTSWRSLRNANATEKPTPLQSPLGKKLTSRRDKSRPVAQRNEELPGSNNSKGNDSSSNESPHSQQ